MHLTEYNNLCFVSLCPSLSVVASLTSKSVRDTIVVGTVSTFESAVKKKLASELDSQLRSRSLLQNQCMLKYFKEIVIDGGSWLVNIYDLTQDMVYLLSNTISALLNYSCRWDQ
jgi:hypothetical protein